MIKIRAHHLACIPRFYSGGYDRCFAKNMKIICDNIRKNPNSKIKILIGKLDDLCIKCPYKYKNKCMQSQEIGKWVVMQDKKVARCLKLKANPIHKAKNIFNLSMDKINTKTIKSVCKNCIFLDNCIKVDINKSFKKDINKNGS